MATNFRLSNLVWGRDLVDYDYEMLDVYILIVQLKSKDEQKNTSLMAPGHSLTACNAGVFMLRRSNEAYRTGNVGL